MKGEQRVTIKASNHIGGFADLKRTVHINEIAKARREIFASGYRTIEIDRV